MDMPPPPDEAGAARKPLPPGREELPSEVPPGFAEDLPKPDPEEANEIRTLIAQLNRPEAVERTQAAMELALYGATAAEAIPALIRALRDSEASVRVAAARGIQGVGFVARVEETAPGLLQALEDPAALVRAEAARALAEIGPLGPHESQTIAALQKLLADTDPRVREAAAESLSYLGY